MNIINNYLSGIIKIQLFLTFALFIFGIDGYAQQNQIQLIDQTSNKPIVNINYKYADQKGLSNESGLILISPEKDENLTLSHIQYGTHIFSDKEIRMAIHSGSLKLEQKSHMLSPVTFLQVHSNAGEREHLNFRVQEKLAHDAGQLLEQFISISSIRKSGAYGFDPVLRGFKYDQLNLVIDGTQCASAACPNRMDPASSQAPLNMIVQAEILKGPHSLRYGNAFGGTINFKSADLNFSDEKEFTGRLSSSYESNGNILRTEGLAGFSSQRSDLKLFGSISNGDDYTAGDGIDVAANFNRTNFGGKFGFKLSDYQNVSILVANNHAEDVDFPALPMDLRKDDTWLINLGHSAMFSKGSLASWKTTAYVTKVDHVMDNLSKLLDPRMADAITTAKTQNLGGRSELRLNFDSNWLYLGTDLRFEKAEGDRERTILMGPMKGKVFHDNVWQDAQILRNGLFGEYHLQANEYQFVFSGRFDLNHAEAKNPDTNFENRFDDMSSTYLNPSLSIGGTRLLNNTTSLGLWLGTAQRSPGIAERYINFFPIGLDPYELIGNPQLDPETNNQIDLIFNHKTENTEFTINLFSSFLRNYISSEIIEGLSPKIGTSPGVRQFINLDKAIITGFELGWNQRLTKNIQQFAELAYTHGENQDSDEALPEIPPMQFRYRLIGSFINHKLNTELSFRNSFKQNRISQSFGETKTPAFQVVDIEASYQLSKWLTCSSGVQNLLDEAYYEHLSRSVRGENARHIYSPGRSFHLSLAFNFL